MTKRTTEKHEADVEELMKKQENAGYRLHPKKCEFFKKRRIMGGTQNDKHGIRPLQDELEAITKIDIPKNEKAEILTRSSSISIETYRKSFSTNRFSQTIAQKTKRMELDTRAHGGVQKCRKS